jgi:hypothetical protein
MKKLILSLFAVGWNIVALAQGKVFFGNDSLHLYYMNPYAVLAADAAIAGQPVPLGGVLPSGKTLVVDLYAGTSSGSLFFYSTTTFSSITPGRQETLGVTLNDPDGAGPATAIPGGATPAYFQVQIRDSAFASAALAQENSSYGGFSSIFTVVPSATIAFNSIVNHGGTALSTWADGTYDMGGGNFGAIMVPLIPEPSVLSMVGLGFATSLLSRRRK